MEVDLVKLARDFYGIVDEDFLAAIPAITADFPPIFVELDQERPDQTHQPPRRQILNPGRPDMTPYCRSICTNPTVQSPMGATRPGSPGVPEDEMEGKSEDLVVVTSDTEFEPGEIEEFLPEYEKENACNDLWDSEAGVNERKLEEDEKVVAKKQKREERATERERELKARTTEQQLRSADCGTGRDDGPRRLTRNKHPRLS